MYIQTVNAERNRQECWTVLVDDLLVVFKRPLTEHQDKVYNKKLPGAGHSLVREFDRKRRRVRFWTCEFYEDADHLDLGFQWEGDTYAGTSTGIMIEKAETARIVRRGMRVRREKNPPCDIRVCPQEADWRVGIRALTGETYDGSYGFEENGIFYRTARWYCNRHLAEARAQSEEFDILKTVRGRKALLRRLRELPQARVASELTKRYQHQAENALLGFQKAQRSFWRNQRRRAKRQHKRLEALYTDPKAVPSEVQWALDQFSHWEREADERIAECVEMDTRLRTRY